MITKYDFLKFNMSTIKNKLIYITFLCDSNCSKNGQESFKFTDPVLLPSAEKGCIHTATISTVLNTILCPLCWKLGDHLQARINDVPKEEGQDLHFRGYSLKQYRSNLFSNQGWHLLILRKYIIILFNEHKFYILNILGTVY